MHSNFNHFATTEASQQSMVCYQPLAGKADQAQPSLQTLAVRILTGGESPSLLFRQINALGRPVLTRYPAFQLVGDAVPLRLLPAGVHWSIACLPATRCVECGVAVWTYLSINLSSHDAIH